MVSRHPRVQRRDRAGFVRTATVVGLLVAAATQDAAADPQPPRQIVAAVPESFPPFYHLTDDGRPGGFAIELFTEIARTAGVTVRYRVMASWQACRDALASGAADVIPTIGITEERRAFALYTQPFGQVTVSLFKRANNRTIRSLDDAFARTVGVGALNVAQRIVAARTDLDRRRFATVEQALGALLTGEIDVLAYPEPVIWRLARDRRVADRLAVVAEPLMTVPTAVGVTKGDPALHARLDHAVGAVIGTPVFRALRRKWLDPGETAPRVATVAWTIVALAVAGVVAGALLRGRRLGGTAVELVFGRRDDPTDRSLRRRGGVLVAVMASAVAAATAATLILLFTATITEERRRLTEIVQSQARLMEAVARFDRRHHADHPGGPSAATLSQITEALANWSGTAEFTLARRVRDQIVFLVRQRAWDSHRPAPVPFAAARAEPMRRALSGLSGTMIGPDYRGVTVLAAFEPVAVLGVGIVAKVDLAEIRAPFIEAALTAGAVGTLILVLGGVAFFRVGTPVIKDALDRERWLRSIFEQAGVGVALIDAGTGRFSRINQRFCDLVGRARSDMLADRLADLVDPEDLPGLTQRLAQLIDGDTAEISLDCRCRHRDRRVVHTDLTVSRTWSPGSPPDVLIAVANDITDRQQARQVIDSFFDQPMNLHLIAEVDGTIRRVNRGWERALGYRTDQLEGTRLFDLVHPEDLARTTAEVEKMKSGEASLYFENRYRHRDGSYRVLAWSASALTEHATIHAVASDITERKSAERELREQLLNLQLAQEIGRIGNWTLDPAVGVPSWSPLIYQIYDRDPALGPPHLSEYREIYQDDQYRIFHRAIRDAIDRGRPYTITLRLNLPGGVTKWVADSCQPDPDRGPAGHYLRGTIQDISDRVTDAERLRALTDHVRLATKAAGVGIWDVDLATGQLVWNEEMFRIYGIVPSGFDGRMGGWLALVHPDDRATAFATFRKKINAEAEFSTEFRIRRPDGAVRSILARGRVTRADDGTPVGMLGTNWDVTDYREALARAEAAKDQAEAANAAKSRFLATMSHELRTPLNAVLGFSRVLADSETDPVRRDQFAIIIDAGTTLLNLIQDILDLTRIEAGRVKIAHEPFDPRREVEATLDLFQVPTAHKGIALGHETAADLPPLVHGDPGLFRQVLINLVGNAVKFTDQGSVTVGLAHRASWSGDIVLTAEVSDTGIGIAPENQQRIFDLFEQEDERTLTRRYGGSGLGLTVARDIIKLLGGEIAVRSAPGVGSCFSFTMPVAATDRGAGRDGADP